MIVSCHQLVKLAKCLINVTYFFLPSSALTGPPERIGTWGLVRTMLIRYINPILISHTDYAHHIGLSPTKFFDIPAALLTPHFQANQRSVINNALEVSSLDMHDCPKKIWCLHALIPASF